MIKRISTTRGLIIEMAGHINMIMRLGLNDSQIKIAVDMAETQPITMQEALRIVAKEK